MFMDNTSSVMLERSMSAAWQRAQLISHNIANQDTPGFKAMRMDFEGQLRTAMERSGGQTRQERLEGLRSVEPRVFADRRTSIRADGNNVDSDVEHIELARVQLQYQALRDKINGHFNRMQSAITGGR